MLEAVLVGGDALRASPMPAGKPARPEGMRSQEGGAGALVGFLTSTLLHLKALILFVINLKLHTTAFAFLKALLLFLFGFCLSSGFIRFCLNSAQTQYLYAASLCAPAWRPQRYKSLVARA